MLPRTWPEPSGKGLGVWSAIITALPLRDSHQVAISMLRNEVQTASKCGNLAAAVYPELLEDVGDVSLDRVL